MDRHDEEQRAPKPAMRTVITNANLIDCVRPVAQAGASIVIEQGRIREIATGGRSVERGDAQIIDAGGA